ncbi:MAG: DUF177 domain-containing protein [Acidisphaera sp.]|nr:DUF177 domain-containing protein [Acidisphaera sp.]
MTPELRRPFAAARVPPQGEEVLVEASAAECAALAARMRIPAVLSLTCRFALAKGPAGSFPARGHLQARVVQVCVVTLDPFEAVVDEAFGVRFVPLGAETDDPDPEAEDEVAYAGGVLELGEAAAEQLALALDPYPRKPGAELPSQDDAPPIPGPLAGLAALKRDG